MKRHGNARLESGGSLILIGDSPDSVILGGLLESRRWKGVLWRFQGRSYTELVRTPSIATAVSLAKTKSGVTIVCSDPDEIERAPLDRDGRSVPIVSELTLIEQLLGRVPLDLVRDDQWVEGARTRLASGRSVAAKRAIDLTAGLLAGLLLLPVIVLTALVVWAARGRPLLCTFPCVGRDDRVFGLHLFRTDDSACPDDPTVMFQTPSNGVWRFLRQNHLHLLPSIWNLIRGDLALIGPRPEAAAIVPVKFHGLPNARFRHLVRPGLISLAQVRFRYSEAPRDTRLALEYDLFYVRHADFALDAKIFLRGMMIAVADSLEYIGWGVHASLRWCWTQATATGAIRRIAQGDADCRLRQRRQAHRQGDARQPTVGLLAGRFHR
jgi:lipopolysaccharide/colanic/teichoic acid biosynthesis glycosyltransferase